MAFEILKPEWGALRPIRGILFDMDGLVLDTETLFTRFWMEAAQLHGFPMTRDQALGMRSLSRTAGQTQLEGYFGPAVNYAEIRATRIRLMSAYIDTHGVEPKPGIYELLDVLDARGIPAAITSSSPVQRIEDYLKPLNLYHRFSQICSGHEVPRGKPEPDIYLHGAAQLGRKPESCLALEDSPAGILSAYRAGCLPVLIPDQDVPGEETQSLCFAIADALSDIPQIISAVNGCL